MNALAISDLGLSQDLDRKALATVIGGNNPCAIVLDRVEYYTSAWSNYYGGTVLANYYNAYGQKTKSTVRWTRSRTQYEYSYWSYYYC